MTKKFLRKTALILATVIMACFFLTGCANVQQEEQTVMAVITDKEYVEAHSNYGYYFDAMKGIFRWKLKRFPAEYNVTIEYKGLSRTYNKKSLYDSYEIGDSIEITYITYYDEDNTLITEGIYAPSISLP